MGRDDIVAMVMALSLHWHRALVTRGSAGDSRCWRGERAMVNPTYKDHDMYISYTCLIRNWNCVGTEVSRDIRTDSLADSQLLVPMILVGILRTVKGSGHFLPKSFPINK